MGTIAENSEEAIRFFEEAVKIAKKLCSEFPGTENQIVLTQNTGSLALQLSQVGRKEAAFELFRHNIDLLVTLTSQNPGLTSGWKLLAGNYHNYCHVMF